MGFGSRIPLTIYTLLKNRINLYEIGTLLGNGHERYNIKENDFVLFHYGYNDVQKNIKLHHSEDWQSEIIYLITNYIKLLNDYREIYKITPIACSIFPNPRNNAENIQIVGTDYERMFYTVEANKIMKQECNKMTIKFFDLYDLICDEDGYLKESVTTDNIHLDYNNKKLRILVENIIMNIVNNE